MLSSLFQSTTIPMLQEVVSFAQARHTLLAGNIANMDVPGYQARDLSVEDFQARLKEALAARDQPAAGSPGEPGFLEKANAATVAGLSQSVLRHDLGNVDLETQASEMVKNQIQHNLAITIMTSQFHLLQTAISGNV
jgi:flagellar basal-body rod protein FlgB